MIHDGVTVGEYGCWGVALFGFAQFAHEASTPGAKLGVFGFEVWGEKGDDGGTEVPQRISGDAFITARVVIGQLGDEDGCGIGHEVNQGGPGDDDGGEPAALRVRIVEFAAQDGSRGFGVGVEEGDTLAGVGEPAGAFVHIIGVEAFGGDGEEAR